MRALHPRGVGRFRNHAARAQVYFVPMKGDAPGAPVEVISGLPVSNHDHAVNGLAFAHDGQLLIQVGGFTNAGIPSAGLGYMPVRFMSRRLRGYGSRSSSPDQPATCRPPARVASFP